MQAESKYQDIHLLALQVKEGNQKAFNILFDKLWEPLYRHTQSIIMDEPASKDIIQEIWIDYWNRRALIQTDNIRAHLFKAAKYKAFNYLRDHKFVPVQLEVLELLPQEEFTIEEEQGSVTLLHNALTDSMNKLPSQCRSIFKMSRLEGYTNDEIASKLNISKRSVENQLSIALKRIRTDLKAHEFASVVCMLYLL
ncbi:sigma-70 family RNA polymerase sigma factor [Imtechella halotolerans]|uniref:ECF subfamily RNA polymerase sigma-24 subunit n=1 Tax=Imtechella halotolerans K1 TaxID=946077 RepID=I0W8M9_9FLAO|nr:sigma-70 family RNA polymerase sigma factor [Imtechella halotolerans]EID72745.1 ECF subfamily RNA polymerase sigma-24 subunit [Imtechella halotolerans K1]WMQ64667.1 sigma-70 family RNA polymerase sigma factor [Imtechella halotolerans]